MEKKRALVLIRKNLPNGFKKKYMKHGKEKSISPDKKKFT